MRRRIDYRRTRSLNAGPILHPRQAEEQTSGEVNYLADLIQNRTPVIVKLTNGEEISGWIEYYDRNFIRVTRSNQPNVFVYKDKIKYIQEIRSERDNSRG